MTAEQSPLELLRSGKAPRNIRFAAAKGLIPLPLPDLVATLIQLTADPDRVVNGEANDTLNGIEEERLIPLLKDENTHPEVLKYFCFDPTRGPALGEAVAMNNSTPDPTISEMSVVADTSLLESILLNQVRLIRFPAILDNILQNRAATPEIRRRVGEIQEEFFRKPSSVYATPAPAAQPVSAQALQALVPSGPQAPAQELEVEVPFSPQDLGLQSRQEISTFQKISQLNTSEKIKLALLGSREERVILVRDPNRVVASMVLKSPKITDQEIESISQMRNVSDDILRTIANTREWLKSYTIIHNLVKNPKTPAAMSMRLLPRIFESDLRLLSRDRSIPELVRRTAERTLQSRGVSR